MSAVMQEQIKPYYETSRFSLFCGDCRSVLPIFSSSYFDSVVCDPPYELGFMGKGWDRSGIAYDVSVWQECLRVLKPGGHLLAFGGSRTYHRLACAIEDAGFEIRDQIQWLYGSGFPKSLDVSKAIDEAFPRIGLYQGFSAHFAERRKANGKTLKEIAVHFPSRNGGLTGCAWNWENGVTVPTLEQWRTLQPMLDLSSDWLALIERVEAQREVVGEKQAGIGSGNTFAFHDANREAVKSVAITTPATDAARQWNGWGTALKPAHEPIVLARKPLIGTVAENVLQHGTGGLNIDGCRISIDGSDDIHTKNPHTISKPDNLYEGFRVATEYQVPVGRWPANVIHDGSEEVLRAFPDAPGQQRTSRDDQRTQGVTYGHISRNGTRVHEPREDSGSAARFFYCAKASQEDRNEGLDDLPLQSAGAVTDRKDGSAGLNSPRAGAGRTNGSRNGHPTVKPTELMKYLCRLITPPGGIVLDPFCGSGSTGKAAMLEHFRFVGIELNEDYCQLAQRRIEFVTRQGLLFP